MNKEKPKLFTEKEYVEQLPIVVNGHELRIKARNSGKKWCIRYIRKVTKEDAKIKDWKYRTEIQCWGNNLQSTAKRMLKKIELYKQNTMKTNFTSNVTYGYKTTKGEVLLDLSEMKTNWYLLCFVLVVFTALIIISPPILKVVALITLLALM